MPMKLREVIQLLEERGWKQIRTKGSHRHFKHPDQRLVVTDYTQESRFEMSPNVIR
jgi:predicted RNA binding protein YcfA (HicA-like mRNA interferase family)